MRRNLNDNDWKRLLERISDGKCTPFLGAGACFGTLPLGRDIAQNWAKEKNFPFSEEESKDLMRVAQFLAIDEDPMYPKERIAKLIKVVKPPNFNVEDEAHGILARMPLPVYITTNYDNFMVQALNERDKKPKQEICRWNKYVKDYPSVFDDAGFDPDETNPVVFHLHGHIDIPESIVLTEDDYLDFLVNISRDSLMIPPRIQRALTGASLLFIGYRIADWNFRVLFRSLVSYLEKALIRGHVSVQIFPLGDESTVSRKDKALEYLDKYFGKLETRVYWGTSQEFTAELRERWKNFK
jgi:SIR2-like domain